MDDYIRRSDALTAIQQLFPCIPLVTINLQKWQEKEKPYIECMDAIKSVPAADVRPVATADQGRCSRCNALVRPRFCNGVWFPPPAAKSQIVNFCSNCGAMFGGTDG